MNIGNNSSFDMMALMLKMQNGRNPRLNTIKMNMNNQQAQLQSAPTMPVPDGWSPPADPLSYRHVGINDHPQALNLTQGDMKFLQLRTCSTSYANAFLNGWMGHEAIGTSAFRQILSEKGVEIPNDVKFDISLNNHGRVTITGLEDAELTERIEKAMSYDSRLINSVLGVFVRSERVLEGHHIGSAGAFSPEQSRLIQIQSDLMDHGVGLHDLTLVNGKIQGLPQELYDKIYGDRSSWLGGMEPDEAKWESWNIDRIRDGAIYFLQNGTAHVPDPNISLTFDNGRMVVNADSGFSKNTGGGVDIIV
ncbi:MAG: hypothetical protein LBU70_02955 [Chitinispirillales bacterium]|jgi:hypothetical protein|nr:hypothetical protein [Chitinispirillales bacterium]